MYAAWERLSVVSFVGVFAASVTVGSAVGVSSHRDITIHCNSTNHHTVLLVTEALIVIVII